MPEFYFGIDFGTTNSAVVAIREELGGRSHFVPVRDGGTDPVPSIVSYDSDGRVRAGTSVKEELIPLREGGLHTVVESVKTVIEEDRLIDGRTPVEVARDLLAYLSKCSQRDALVQRKIDRAVFAIPVAWSASKRSALRQAARQAGIDVTGFVSEPTAALLAMHQGFRRHEFVVVFDWGGGTLDVAVLRRGEYGWREVAKRVLPRAGDYIDDRLARFLHESIVTRASRDVAFEELSPRTRQVLRNRAEEVKRRMQRAGLGDERVQFLRYEISTGDAIPQPSALISKAQFADLVEPVVNEALECLHDAIRSSGISRHQIGALLVIGGSSQIAALRQHFEGDDDPWPVQYGPIEVDPDMQDDATSNPAWLVARGAALLARAGGRCARLADDIGLLVADSENPFFAILRAGDTAAHLGQPREHMFGVVEETKMATFVVAAQTRGQRPTRIGEIGLPIQGFLNEELHFSLMVDRDDVLLARAVSASRRREAEEQRIENVRWSYDLDDIGARSK